MPVAQKLAGKCVMLPRRTIKMHCGLSESMLGCYGKILLRVLWIFQAWIYEDADQRPCAYRQLIYFFEKWASFLCLLMDLQPQPDTEGLYIKHSQKESNKNAVGHENCQICYGKAHDTTWVAHLFGISVPMLLGKSVGYVKGMFKGSCLCHFVIWSLLMCDKISFSLQGRSSVPL